MGVVGSIRSGLSKIFKKGSKAVKNNIYKYADDLSGVISDIQPSGAISEGGWVFDESVIKSSNSNVLNKIKDTFSDVVNTVKTGAQFVKEGYTDYRNAKKGIYDPEGANRLALSLVTSPEGIKAGEELTKEYKAYRKRLNGYKKEFKKTPVIKEAKFNHKNAADYRKKLSYMDTKELIDEGKKVGIDDYKDRVRQEYIDTINKVSGDEQFRVYESEKMSINELYNRAESLNIDTTGLIINVNTDFANDIYQKTMNNEMNKFIESRRVGRTAEKGAKEAVEEALEKQKKGLGFDGVWGNITGFVKENPIVTAGALVAGGLVLTELLDED